jgi:hypothetical protein
MVKKDSFVSAKVAIVEDSPQKDFGTYAAQGSWTVGCEISARYRVSNPELLLASSLGLANPFALAWELTPLSFVLDWFVSVGDFLNGLGATLGCDFVGGYETHFVRTNGVEFTNNYFPQSRHVGTPPKHKLDAFAMERKVLYQWPKPRVVLNLNFSLNQLASAMALAQQRANI